MSNWNKSAVYGGIYTKTQSSASCSQCDQKISCKYHKLISQLENYRVNLKKSWEKSRNKCLLIKDNLICHMSKKQELYWPILISVVLLLLVLLSKITFSQNIESPNNLPVESNSNLNFIGLEKKTDSGKLCLESKGSGSGTEKVAGTSDDNKEDLKNEVAGIVKNTPMASMIDSISEKPRPVAAFIVGIAMKESKFGVYSPKKNGRDCYNYWGYRGRENTTASGYSCFNSPEHAVEVVGGKIESLIDRGVKNPAQMISWKCGRSCAGHGDANVKKWISDVAIYFNRINS